MFHGSWFPASSSDEQRYYWLRWLLCCVYVHKCLWRCVSNWSLTSLKSWHYWKVLMAVLPTLCACLSEKKWVFIFQMKMRFLSVLSAFRGTQMQLLVLGSVKGTFDKHTPCTCLGTYSSHTMSTCTYNTYNYVPHFSQQHIYVHVHTYNIACSKVKRRKRIHKI